MPTGHLDNDYSRLHFDCFFFGYYPPILLADKRGIKSCILHRPQSVIAKS